MPSLNSPIITGDVSGGLHSTKVEKLQNNAVAATAPASGQVLTWDGSQWAPAASTGGAGGGGANGLTYYLNQGTDADAPTINLPGTPKQLGRSADASQTTAASGTLTPETWTQFAGFVTESTPQDPGASDIPAGLWDLNCWIVGVAGTNQANQVRVKVFKYNGTDAPTLLATSAAVTIGTTAALVGFTVLVPETAMLLTDRIFVSLEAYATGNNHSVTGQFGGNTPSHVHTSLGLVAGTGLWKNVAGALQSPASLLVDADVDAAAAIAQSKISGLTNALIAKAGTAVVQVFTSGGTWAKPAGAKSVNIQLLGGAGGGGSGRKDSTAGTVRCGGGGGGGGGYANFTVPADLLGAIETVTIGPGGAGGVAQSTDGASNPGTATGNGPAGGAGGATSFGSFVVPGGVAGSGGTATTGSGGAAILQGNAGGPANASGGAGNSGAPSSATSGANFGGVGGGGGGGITNANFAASGGSGGRSIVANLAGGIAGTAGVAGGVGNANSLASTGLCLTGSGGGGGGGANAASGGAGGAGGFPAAGGGGGGACGFAAGSSGAGGAGAAGVAVITTYF